MTLQDRCKKFALNFPASNSVDGKHVWNVDLIQSFAEEIRNEALEDAAKNAEIEKFRKALEFYADKENWDLHEMTPTIWDDGAVDCGNRARIALDIVDEIDTIRWPNDAGN